MCVYVQHTQQVLAGHILGSWAHLTSANADSSGLRTEYSRVAGVPRRTKLVKHGPHGRDACSKIKTTYHRSW